MRIGFIVLILSLAAPAAATPTVRSTLDGDDAVWMTLTGAGTGLVAGVLGGGIGSLFDAPCTPSVERSCPPPAFTLAGAASGLIIGAAWGVDWYGGRAGYDGSFGSAVIGGLLGNVASGVPLVLIVSVVDDEAIGLPLVAAVMIGMPALGATLGYQYSLPDDASAAVSSSGALVDVQPAGVRFGVPVMAVAPELRSGQRGWSTSIRLAGGAF